VTLTRDLCEERGCIYNPDISQGPMCYFNLDNYGYKVVGQMIETDLGFTYQLQRKSQAGPFNNLGSPDIQTLMFTVEMRSNEVLRFKVIGNIVYNL